LSKTRMVRDQKEQEGKTNSRGANEKQRIAKAGASG